MILAPNFFQPANFYQKKFSCISQIYDAQYWSQISDFMDKLEAESPKDANQIYNLLLIYFNSTDTAAGYVPLNDKERFWILRAFAKIPFGQRAATLVLAMDLSPQRPNYEMLEALCLMSRDSLRGTEFRKPNTMADREQSLIDLQVRQLIYKAINLISGNDEHDAHNNKIIAARYFLAASNVDSKKALAEKVISSLSTGGITNVSNFFYNHFNAIPEVPRDVLETPKACMARIA